jgi:hypothetical protein
MILGVSFFNLLYSALAFLTAASACLIAASNFG